MFWIHHKNKYDCNAANLDSENFENIKSKLVFPFHVFEHIVSTAAYLHRIRQETVHKLKFCFLVPPIESIISYVLLGLQFSDVSVITQSLSIIILFYLFIGFRLPILGLHWWALLIILRQSNETKLWIFWRFGFHLLILFPGFRFFFLLSNMGI